MTPYTYFIGWPDLNTFYYGVRYGRTCDPSDLWVTYFTSSKEVHAFRALHGDPPLREVRHTFKTKEAAREWEHKVLRRMKAPLREDFLNRTTAKAPSMLGRSHSEETRRKQSLTQKGKPKNPASVLKMRVSLTGRKMSDAARAAQSRGHMGLEFSESHRANIAASKIGRKHWTNGTEYRCCREKPGPEWYPGKRQKKRAAEAAL